MINSNFNSEFRSRPYIILMLLVALVSAGSLSNTFLGIDDDYFIVNNPRIDIPLSKIPSIFITPLGRMYNSTLDTAKYSYYRPLLELLYILNYKIWGPNPVGFHLVNLTFHLLSSILVYRSGLLLFKDTPDRQLVSLFGASVFAVHPANNELIARVAMNENIYGFLIILSLYLFLKERKYLSLFVFSLALLSKEGAIIFPFALAVFSISSRGFKKGIIEAAPYTVIAGIYFLVRAVVVDIIFIPGLPVQTHVKFLTTIGAVSDYTKLLLIPYPLSPFYSVRLYTSIFEPKVIAAILLLLLMTILILKLRKESSMLFLLLFPVTMLAPVILNTNTFPLIPERIYIAERFLYVPLMGLSLFVSAFFIKNAGHRLKSYISAGFIAVLIIFSIITINANKTWKNDHALYTKIMHDAPDSSISHHYQAMILFDNGKLDEAIVELNKALTPYFMKVMKKSYENMTTAEKEKAQQNNVYNKYGRTVDTNSLGQYNPAFAEIYFNLGRVYLAQGNIEKAARKFKVAATLRPYYAEAHYNLAVIYHKEKRFEEAIKQYQETLKFNPNHSDAGSNLKILLKKIS